MMPQITPWQRMHVAEIAHRLAAELPRWVRPSVEDTHLRFASAWRRKVFRSIGQVWRSQTPTKYKTLPISPDDTYEVVRNRVLLMLEGEEK